MKLKREFPRFALWDAEGNPIESVPHPMMPFQMRLPKAAERLSILRKLK